MAITKIVDAFAHGAASPNITPVIPENQATPGSGTASFDLGFPPETMQNPAAGGIPPFGNDMNGILFMITSVLAFINQGNTFVYDGDFAASIGGYAPGAIVMSDRTDAAGTGFWLNLVAGNMTDPDNPPNPSTSGWAPLNNVGHTNVPVTSGVVTLTADQAARGSLIFSGSLTGNVQVVLPTWEESWLCINGCTLNGFTLTVKTAAGTGVAIPAGGYAQPTGVYGNGTDINLSFYPLSVAIDQAPTPSTIAERNNTGQLLATYFNQNSGLETPAIGAVFCENTAEDGYFRKVALAQVLEQMNIAQAVTGGWNIGALQIRYGSYNNPAGTNTTQTFGTRFSSACNVVMLTIRGSTGVEFWTHSPPGGTPAAPSATQFSSYSNANTQIDYFAIGS